MKKKVIIISILLIIFILLLLGIYKCPIKLIFGISCPLCGMTRAFFYAMQFNFKKAFYYHMLWPFVLVGIILHVLIEFKIVRLNKKIIYFLLYLFCLVNLIYYFYRLFNDSNVVYFNFSKSLIYKILTNS